MDVLTWAIVGVVWAAFGALTQGLIVGYFLGRFGPDLVSKNEARIWAVMHLISGPMSTIAACFFLGATNGWRTPFKYGFRLY
jgi:hypothetical protein